MTRLFLVVFAGVLSCAGDLLLYGQEVKPKVGLGAFVEVRPYGDKRYGGDREFTGAFFRKLRRIRAAEGNAAAAARFPAAMEAYLELRKEEKFSKAALTNSWRFWAWHEAQYDTGKDDSEWSMMLFRELYNQALGAKEIDWATHVRPNVINAYAELCQWAQVRAISNQAEDYFASQGFELDPKKLPEKGQWEVSVPFVKMREFPMKISNSKHVVYWQRREEKDPKKATYLDNLLVALIRGLSAEDIGMGQWDRAIERSLWIREWCDLVKRHNADKAKNFELKRDHDDEYRYATLKMANILYMLGYGEKSLELIEVGLGRKGASKNDMSSHTALQVLKDRIVLDAGREDGELLARMDAAIGREGKFDSIGEGDMDAARIVKADFLVKAGKLDEAEEILKGICARKQRRLSGWMDAELELVDLMLMRGSLEQAGTELRGLMRAVRTTGVKLDELHLYRMYVKWAVASGNWEEALRGQREVMRLLEAFRMTPLLPLENVRLSAILAALGNAEEAKRLAELARNGAEGRDGDFVKLVQERLAAGAGGVAKAVGQVAIQPTRVVSMALDEFPSRAVVSLVNHGGREATGRLNVKGLPAKIFWDVSSGLGVVEVEDAPGNAVERTSGEIRIEAGAMAVFSCSGKLANEVSKTVVLEWVGSGAGAERCEWTIEAGDKESEGAVIDAAAYVDDPFFMIPVHHHLQSKGKGLVNLRVVTSQPCRVEMYDGLGALQMVDAEGNGSLADTADWLGMDRDRNFSAEVLPDEASGEARFLLQLDPKDWDGKEPIRVRIEWQVDGEWFLAAEDSIVSGK